ncbi:YciI family protein [Cellulomonas wangsupingiae]|uniref:YciI family protein n=1 Tax=Cellulomonas wangsupingiae TaxID=2968085 RepID=A0ABY5K4M7_9CELL|nr:YciI family protein [Cellulomonas wangsupingiae]MCC2334897.1 YciI family protein [Cellulomonas wangsupingiae]UUI65397.1 YciI family protein [Cellulomonas wangsupingiae]
MPENALEDTMTTPTTYLMLLWGDPDALLDPRAAYAAHERFEADCAAQGHEVLLAKELADAATARTLTVGGRLTDGPYAETTEQLGGLYRIRTADPEGLLRLAAPLVTHDGGTLELRPEVLHDDGAAHDGTTPGDAPLHLVLLRGDPAGAFDLDAVFAAHDAFVTACEQQGHRVVGGEELGPHTAARLVRTTPAGQPVLCDGPYTETTEQLGGYYLVRTDDPDALLRLAAPLVEAEGRGTVEVRGMVHDGVPVAG